MTIKKAVIPAAGFGTRMLPFTKAVPKEMYPIIDKPAIQYIVEEAVKSGITDILIVISRGKSIIEDHFDYSPELCEMLVEREKLELRDKVSALSKMANLYYIRQAQPLGLGHAVLCAEAFVGDEPFAVLYGDDVIIGENPTCLQLCQAYEKHGKGAVGMKEVSKEDIKKYSSLKVEKLENSIYTVSDMAEKPQTDEEIFSLFSILGRCVLPPEIFPLLRNLTPGSGGEIQLTDAMAILARTKGMIGVDFEGKRYDMGNKLGVLQANIEVGLTHPEIKDDFKKYLKEIAKKLD